MKARTLRWPGTILVVGLFSLLMSGCVVPPGGYGYPGNAGFSLGYFEPAGGHYGGWGSGYAVGPVRNGRGYEQRGGHAGTVRRPVPSIPSRGRTSSRGQEGHR